MAAETARLPPRDARAGGQGPASFIIDGLRVTDAETRDFFGRDGIVAGHMNKKLVAALASRRAAGVGLCGRRTA